MHRLAPAALAAVAVALLAGCASPAEQAATRVGDSLEDPDDAPASVARIGQLRFPGEEANSTVAFSGEFPTPNTCFVEDECPESTLRFDLTPQVPAGVPVEVSATLDSDACLDAWFELTQASLLRYTDGGSLAALLVRHEGGTVTLAVRDCSLFAGGFTDTAVPVEAEARTVSRPDVLPVYVPVAVDLQAGDRVEAKGDDLSDLVVVPPGQPPRHLADEPSFVVADGLPAGRYILVALGSGTVTLRGADRLLQPLEVKTVQGEERDLASGQELSWDFALPGVPLYAGLVVYTSEEQQDVVSARGAESARLECSGKEVATYAESSPLPSLSIGGFNSMYIRSGYLDDSLLGNCTAHVKVDPAVGMKAMEHVAYVEP